MEEYFAAKQLLFDGRGRRRRRRSPCINRDDEYGAPDRDCIPGTEVLWYGLGAEADLRARHISSGFQGLRFDVQFGKQRFPVESPLIGQDQRVQHSGGVRGAALAYGIAPETVARGIADLRGGAGTLRARG